VRIVFILYGQRNNRQGGSNARSRLLRIRLTLHVPLAEKHVSGEIHARDYFARTDFQGPEPSCERRIVSVTNASGWLSNSSLNTSLPDAVGGKTFRPGICAIAWFKVAMNFDIFAFIARPIRRAHSPHSPSLLARNDFTSNVQRGEK